MRIKIIGSSIGTGTPDQFLISYVCNETVAIDAGSIGLMSPLIAQARIRDVFLSHSHIDHTASLPTFLDNVYIPGPDCVTTHAHPQVLESLHRDFFNDRVWPDLIRVSAAETPFFRAEPLIAEQMVEAGGLSITPVALDHVVPTFGFIIADQRSAVAIVSDTAPSTRIWDVLAAVPNLCAVFLEASFPNELSWLAEKTKHLTPRLLRCEVEKLGRDVPIVAIHLKPLYQGQIIEELAALGLPQLEIGEPERVYEF